jgi:hypothetical protein
VKKTFFILIFFYICVAPAFANSNGEYKNAIKTTLLSFITGSAKLTYERALFPKQSIEITGGFIGIGFDKFKVKPKGGLFQLAYKFMFLQPDNTPLGGLYVKPQYAMSIFDYNSKNASRINSSWHTIMGCFGYQYIVKMFVLDGFIGAGVGLGNRTELQYHHGFISRYNWLTLTFGLKIGLAF